MTDQRKFSSEITDLCMSVKVTSGLPQLSATIDEVTQSATKSFDMEDSEFGANFSHGLMPKACLTKLKNYSAQLRAWVRHHGFPAREEGRGIEYYMLVEDLADAYAKEAEIKEEMRAYMSDMVDDWDAYRERILKALGSIENPEKYFYYKTKDEYLADFHLEMHITPVSNATMIPASLVDESIRQRIEESMEFESEFLLQRLGDALDYELKQLHRRLMNTDSSINSKTFNSINHTREKVVKFSFNRSDELTRACKATATLVGYLLKHPEKVSEHPTRRSMEGTFNKIYSVLGTEPLKFLGEDND